MTSTIEDQWMNSSMQKGISALKEAVQEIEDEVVRLCLYIPKAESIVTSSDDGKICSLPGDINKLHDVINDIHEKRAALRQRKEENDEVIETYVQELSHMFEAITENIVM